jgi:MFS family permease
MLVAALLASPLFYVISAARLGWTSSHQPATDYTAQSSINAIGIAAGGVLAAFVASSVGWQGLFAAAALLGVLSGALFLLLEGWVERAVGARRQGDDASQPVGDRPGVAEAVA